MQLGYFQVIEGILILPAIVTAVTGSRKFKANKAGEMAKVNAQVLSVLPFLTGFN